MSRRSAIGHVESDCFYVSAERVSDSFLVGKPVGVLGNQGACVIAKSYEMRAAGVQTGMLIGTEGSAQRALSSPSDRFDLLLAAARSCFRRAWQPPRAASRMHVNGFQLRRPGSVQPDLFDPLEGQARAVAKVKRAVNARLGRFALRSGATLPLADVYRDEAQSYDLCDVRGKSCF